MGGEERPRALGFERVQDGPYAAVRLAPKVYEYYAQLIEQHDKLSRQRRVHLERYFQRFCELGPQSLGEEKFKWEDSFPDSKGRQVPVYAFKPFKLRIYGGILTVGGKRCFVGMRFDPAKKQDKANQRMLKDTAADIASLAEYGE